MPQLMIYDQSFLTFIIKIEMYIHHDVNPCNLNINVNKIYLFYYYFLVLNILIKTLKINNQSKYLVHYH